jgi:hypothetical protein
MRHWCDIHTDERPVGVREEATEAVQQQEEDGGVVRDVVRQCSSHSPLCREHACMDADHDHACGVLLLSCACARDDVRWCTRMHRAHKGSMKVTVHQHHWS